jgi:hypothetical protein
MYRIIFTITLIFTCFISKAQEVATERETTYSFHLNKLKTQDQVTIIESSVKNLDNVTSCQLDWLNYTMTVKVNEGGDKGNFSMEKLKGILLDNKAALKSFTKESKRL